MRQGKWNITEKFDRTPATRDAIIANRKQMKWCASWAGLYIRLKSFVLYKENGCRAALFVEKEKIVRNEGTSWLGRGFFPFFFGQQEDS